MQRRCLDDSTCPVARSLDSIGDWWTLLIVRDAMLGVRRFSDFQRSLGLARNVLTSTTEEAGCRWGDDDGSGDGRHVLSRVSADGKG